MFRINGRLLISNVYRNHGSSNNNRTSVRVTNGIGSTISGSCGFYNNNNKNNNSNDSQVVVTIQHCTMSTYSSGGSDSGSGRNSDKQQQSSKGNNNKNTNNPTSFRPRRQSIVNNFATDGIVKSQPKYKANSRRKRLINERSNTNIDGEYNDYLIDEQNPHNVTDNHRIRNKKLDDTIGLINADLITEIQRRNKRMQIYQKSNLLTNTTNTNTKSTTTSSTDPSSTIKETVSTIGSKRNTGGNSNTNNMRRRTHAEKVQIEPDSAEENLAILDYFLSEPGSTEEQVFERRAKVLAFTNDKEKDFFFKDINNLIHQQTQRDLGIPAGGLEPDFIQNKRIKDFKREVRDTLVLGRTTDYLDGGYGFNEDFNETEYVSYADDAHRIAEQKKDGMELYDDLLSDDEEENDDYEHDLEDNEHDPALAFDSNTLAHGEWSELLVCVNRNVSLWRGGRIEGYRALVVGGNCNGCGGYAIGRSADPMRAVDVAARLCRKNIFFVDRYAGNGICHDLVGTQNSCKVLIRPKRELGGNWLIREILQRFGIVNATGKTFGNRSLYNQVHATFKALATHQSIEHIAMKRGKRLLSVDRARRLQV